MAGQLSVVWEGLDAFKAGLERAEEDAREGARLFVASGAALAENHMKDRAGEGGRHAKGTPTTASLGGGPAVITGTLRRSIRHSPITPVGNLGYATEIGPTAIYGRRVELEYNYPYAQPGWEQTIPALAGLARRYFGGVGRPG